MKRSVLFALLVGVLSSAAAVFANTAAFAAEAKNAAAPDLVEEAEAKLHATVWAVKLTPIGGSPAKAKEDRISFESGKVISDKLAADGYASSNYTLTVGDDGVPVWETMQSAGEKGVAFWRGELHGDIMRGILSKHPTKGAAEDYSFSGSKTADTAVVPAPKTTVTNPAPSASSAPSDAVPAAVKEAQPVLPEPSAAIDATQNVVSEVQAVAAPVNVQVDEPAAPEAVAPVVRQPASVPAVPAVSPAVPASVPEKAQAPAKKRSGWLW